MVDDEGTIVAVLSSGLEAVVVAVVVVEAADLDAKMGIVVDVDDGNAEGA